MTTATVQRQPQKRRAHRLDPIRRIFVKILCRNRPTLHGDQMISTKSGRQHLLRLGIRQQITRHLLDHKTIKWQVIVVALDHPIPPRPTRAPMILQVAIRIPVTRHIQPTDRHPFPITRRRQQSIDLPLVGSRLLVRQKPVQLLQSRGQPCQVKSHPPQKTLPLRFRRKLQPRRLQALDDEGIKRIPHRSAGHRWTNWRHKCPVLLIPRSPLNPSPKRCFLRHRKRLVRLHRWHDLVPVMRINPRPQLTAL